MSESKHTPGPWNAAYIVHADTGKSLTPDEIGEYVANAVRQSAAESGTENFLFVWAEKHDGPADVALVGNGPTSPANARLIAAAPDLLVALMDCIATLAALNDGYLPGRKVGSVLAQSEAAIAKAIEGER